MPAIAPQREPSTFSLQFDRSNLRALRADVEKYVGCQNCGAPVNVELSVLQYANRLATAIHEMLEKGGPEVMPRVMRLLQEFVLDTNTLLISALEEDPLMGNIARATRHTWEDAEKRHSAGAARPSSCARSRRMT